MTDRNEVIDLRDDDTQEPQQDPENTSAKSWWAATRRAQKRMRPLNLPLLASGVAFWGMLSIFPMLIGLVTIYGLVASPEDVTKQVDKALGSLSPQAQQVVSTQLKHIASGGQGLSIGLIVSIVGLLWSASAGVQNLMRALTTAFEQEETRGFVAMKARALVLTIGAIVLGILVIAGVGLMPHLLARALDNAVLRVLLDIVGGLVLFGLVVAGLAILFRFGPANRPVGMHWASSGALISSVLLAITTVAFAIYVNNFSKYGNVYGALAGAVVLMLWLYYSTYVVLIGALINAEAERHVKGDTDSYPEGKDRPITRLPDDEKHRSGKQRQHA